MRPHPTLTVISLGGGVQSSVMALMANEGEFGRLPDLREGLALHKSRTCTPCGYLWLRSLRWTRQGWEQTGRETSSGTSARDTVECEAVVKGNNRDLDNPRLRGPSPASSVDSRPRSCYVFDTTPISSAVGSRPSSGAVSVFVWE